MKNIEIRLTGNKELMGANVYSLYINGFCAQGRMTYGQAKREVEAMQSPNYARNAWEKEMEASW